jgi:hypothetical protein
MTNIEKLIASTKINHGGVEATETKIKAMGMIIEVLLKTLVGVEQLNVQHAIEEFGNASKADNWGCVKKIRQGIQQAEEIAGVVC